MDKITICDLEVHYRVGVTPEERAQPQRLLVSVQILHDFTQAAQTDALEQTVDYFAVTQRLLTFGSGRSWQLIERLAVDIAGMITRNFHVPTVTVEVKKFVVQQARYVSVTVTRAAK